MNGTTADEATMKAVVFRDLGDIRLEDVPEPRIEQPTGAIDPRAILTRIEPLTRAIDAYKAFDRREPGWIKGRAHAAGGGVRR
jgi:threonine dehydrogenase-like Zn-dependent dehydrogenase